MHTDFKLNRESDRQTMQSPKLSIQKVVSTLLEPQHIQKITHAPAAENLTPEYLEHT
jgi:hypothetical protein